MMVGPWGEKGGSGWGGEEVGGGGEVVVGLWNCHCYAKLSTGKAAAARAESRRTAQLQQSGID